MRVLEPTAELVGERLVLARALRERPRQPPRDRVDEDHRREVAVREDVGADGDRVGGEVLDDALVEALEPCREECQPLLDRELLDEGLGELPAFRRQRNDAVLRDTPVDRVERRRDDVDAQHHAGARRRRARRRPAGHERRVVAVGVQPQVELAAENRRDGALLGQPGERVRDEREDIELHQ